MKRAFVLLLLVGCGQQAFQDKSAQADKPAEQAAKSWPTDAKSLEKIVAAHVQAKSSNPKSVEFVKWGPHMLEGEIPMMVVVDPSQSHKWLRLVFRRPNTAGEKIESDMIFTVSQGKVTFEMPNFFKEHWVKQMTRPISGIE